MLIDITGHHVEVTSALRAYVTEKMQKIMRHSDQVISIHVILKVEKLQQLAEATLNVGGRQVFATVTATDNLDPAPTVTCVPPSGSPRALPVIRRQWGSVSQKDGVERADIDSEFKCGGRNDAIEAAGAELLLLVATLGGQVAAAIAADPAPGPEVLAQGLAQVGEHDLHGDPRPPEDHRLTAGAQEPLPATDVTAAEVRILMFVDAPAGHRNFVVNLTTVPSGVQVGVSYGPQS